MILFEEIRDLSPLSIKKLNDQLRALWNKVMNVTEKDINDNAVTEPKIDNGAVTTDKISDSAITAEKIAAGTITADSAIIADAAITNAKIANGAVTNAKIANASIDTAKIQTGAITTALIGTGAVDTAQIADGSITDAKIVSLTANKIAAGTIDTGQVTVQGTNGKLKVANNRLQVFDNQAAPVERVAIGDVNNDGTIYGLRVRGADGVTVLYDQNGVYNEGITDGAITNPKIGTNAVDSRVIAANAVTADKIVAGAVTTDKLDAQAVTANKIAAGAITAGSAIIADGAITTAKIGDAQITNAKIATAAIDAAKIQDGTITNAEIANATITGAKIASATIDTANIKDAAITNAKIANASVDNAKISSLDAGKITTGTLSADRIGANSITADKIVIGNPTNMVENPSFENGQVGWYPQNKAMYITTGGGHLGGQCFKIWANGTLRDCTNINVLIEVHEGERYYCEGWYRSDSGTNGAAWPIALVAYDKDKTAIAWPNVTRTPVTSWTKASFTYTVPAGVCYIKPMISVRNTSTTGAWYFDDLSVSLAAPRQLPSYATMEDTGFKVYDGGGVLRTHMGQYASGKYGFWADSGYYVIRDHGLEMSLEQKPNLIPDHSFECLKTTGDVDPTYYDFAIISSQNMYDWMAGGAPRVISLRNTDGIGEVIYGTQCAVVNYSNCLRVHIQCGGNRQYTFSGFVAKGYRSSSAPQPRVSIFFLDASLNVISNTYSAFTVNPDLFDWKRVRYTFTTPSNTWFLRIEVRSSDSGWIYWDGVQVVEGEYPVRYEPEENSWRHMFSVAGLQGNLEHIIESGSNSNGSYVKFGDGTMICWVRMSVTDQAINQAYGSLFIGTRKWTFPAKFFNPPTVTCSEFKWGTGASWGGVSGATYSYATLRGYDVSSRASGTTCTIAATASGKYEQ